jgi:hypothetical protein
MEKTSQVQNVPYQDELDEELLNDDLYVSAGYFVRTGILAGVPSPQNGCVGCGS